MHCKMETSIATAIGAKVACLLFSLSCQFSLRNQRAKKVVSDSLQIVDFVLDLSDEFF